MPFTIVKANITTICQNNHNWRPTPIIGTDNFTYFPGVEILQKGTDSIKFLAETVPFYKISTPGNWVNFDNDKKNDISRSVIEQFQDATGKYLSGQCEWNFALGLKD